MEECIREVSQLTDGSHINFSELAKKYVHNNDNGEILKNGGQIGKQALKKISTSTDLNIMERLILIRVMEYLCHVSQPRMK